ncbi:MAG: tetratricopeptide repeat protein [Thermoplasmata archaeon]
MSIENKIEALRKMPVSELQKVAHRVANSLGMKIETTFTKGEFIELTGKIQSEGKDLPFVLVFHSGAALNADFLSAFREVVKKENANAIIISLGNVEKKIPDENIRIVAGSELVEFLEEQGIEVSAELPLREVLSEKNFKPKVAESALPSTATLEKYMKNGMKLYEKKEFEKANQFFDEVLKLKPNYDRAIIMKAKTYEAMGETESAIEIYRRALANLPEDYELWFEYADMLHRLERYDEELECYTKILAINKKFDKAWNNMGIVYFIKEKYENAAYCFERAVKILPDNPDYLNNLATAQKKLSKIEEALSNYKKVLAVAPEHVDTLLNMGMLYNEMGKHEEAYRTFRKYLLKNKDSSKGWHLAGIAAMNAGAYSQAIQCFEEALKIKPDLKESKEGLREAKRKFSQIGDKTRIPLTEDTKLLGAGISERRKTEIEILGEKEGVKEEQELKPKAPIGVAALVSAIAKGEGIPEKSVSATSDDIVSAWELLKKGEISKAEHLLEGKETKASPWFALVSGYVYSANGKHRDADAAFTQVLSHTNSIPAIFGKENAKFYMGDFEEAEKLMDTLIRKFPYSRSLLLKRCITLYAKRDFAKCENELKKMGKEFQYSEIYWYLMGSVYLETGNKENAEKCFKNVLKIRPEHRGALKKLEQIKG